jgi:methionyl-tRNA synthetase
MRILHLLFISLLLLLARLGQEKKEDILSLLLKKKTKNLQKKTIKPTTTTDSMPSIPPSSLSPKEHLCEALRSLIQAYRGLEGEEQEEQVR